MEYRRLLFRSASTGEYRERLTSLVSSIAPLLSRRLSRVLTVGSAQSVLDASAATTSSALRGWRSHRTRMTWASASLMGMSFTTVIFNDYTRKQTGCQAIRNPPPSPAHAPTPPAPPGTPPHRPPG